MRIKVSSNKIRIDIKLSVVYLLRMDIGRLAELAEEHRWRLEAMKKLSDFPLSFNPRIEDLEFDRSVVQRLYRRMKAKKFEGDLIDYVCILSYNDWWFGIGSEEMSVDIFKHVPAKFKAKSIINNAKSDYFDSINLKNVTRLAMKNPALLHRQIVYASLGPEAASSNEGKKEIKTFFTEIYKIASETIINELLKDNDPDKLNNG